MRVGQLSESDANHGLELPFYSSRHAKEPHLQGNQFDLGNRGLRGYDVIALTFRE